MIDRIEINNFATIEHLSFDLGEGFNVITGETGAGKSVLITAVSTVRGDRADTTMVRTGADRAFIQIAGTRNGEEVIISREILAGGKSVSKLNGEMVTLGQIRSFCSDWIDIHGQYDNQQILDPLAPLLETEQQQMNIVLLRTQQLNGHRARDVAIGHRDRSAQRLEHLIAPAAGRPHHIHLLVLVARMRQLERKVAVVRKEDQPF